MFLPPVPRFKCPKGAKSRHFPSNNKGPSPTALIHRERIAALAARHKLPAIYPYRPNVIADGLMSYGIDLSYQFRQAASYIDRILKGEKPGNLPSCDASAC
jgi:ABC-type uncharacterized transport system substrate-binding protein